MSDSVSISLVDVSRVVLPENAVTGAYLQCVNENGLGVWVPPGTGTGNASGIRAVDYNGELIRSNDGGSVGGDSISELGAYSCAFGERCVTSAPYGIAIGSAAPGAVRGPTSGAIGSIAIGSGANDGCSGAFANSVSSIAIGGSQEAGKSGAIVSSHAGIAIGAHATVTGLYGVAIGGNVVQFGVGRTIAGYACVAIGNTAQAPADFSIAIGSIPPSTQASATNSIAFMGGHANGVGSIAIGEDARTNHVGGIALGAGIDTIFNTTRGPSTDTMPDGAIAKFAVGGNFSDYKQTITAISPGATTHGWHILINNMNYVIPLILP